MFLNLFAFSLKIPEDISQAGLEATDKISEQIVSSGYTGDLLIIGFAIIIVLFFAFLVDAHNILIAFVSIYIAWLATAFFPYHAFATGTAWTGEWSFKIILIVLIFCLSSAVLSATHLFRGYYQYNFFARWMAAIVNGLLFVGFLSAMIMAVLPQNFLMQFSTETLRIFISEIGRFVWIVLPLAGMFLTRPGRKGPGRPAR